MTAAIILTTEGTMRVIDVQPTVSPDSQPRVYVDGLLCEVREVA